MKKTTNLTQREGLQIHLIYPLVFIGSVLLASSFVFKDMQVFLAITGVLLITVGCVIAGVMFGKASEEFSFTSKHNEVVPLQEAECAELLYRWFCENRDQISVAAENTEQSIKIILLDNYERILREKAAGRVAYGKIEIAIVQATKKIYKDEIKRPTN